MANFIASSYVSFVMLATSDQMKLGQIALKVLC